MAERMTSEEIRAEIEQVKAHLQDKYGSEQDLMDALDHIDIDLHNTLQEYVATTGKDPSEYYKWKRKAKWANYHKRKRLVKTRSEIRDLEINLGRLRMLLTSIESGYRGESAEGLLGAMYHLTMQTLDATGHELDAMEIGLIMTVRMRLGYGAPGEGEAR